MEKTERMAVLEAVLFAHGDPVGIDKLAAALDTGSWPPKTSTAPMSAAPWKTGGPRPCPRRRWRR